MKAIKIYSPNHDRTQRSSKSIKIVVIHYTGMQSERESIIRLTSARSKVSSHYLINQKGVVFNLVQDKYVAWHAGKSSWLRYKNLNKNSVGIELVNKGHQFGYENFKKKQIISLIKLCKKLIKKYKIKKRNIVGHSDIAPLRKIDPGKKFPWQHLSENQVGIWHEYNLNILKKFRKIKILKKQDKNMFVRNLSKIGYCFPVKKNFFFIKTVKAFQSHFRKELVDGIIDQECLLIAKNLANKL